MFFMIISYITNHFCKLFIILINFFSNSKLIYNNQWKKSARPPQEVITLSRQDKSFGWWGGNYLHNFFAWNFYYKYEVFVTLYGIMPMIKIDGLFKKKKIKK